MKMKILLAIKWVLTALRVMRKEPVKPPLTGVIKYKTIKTWRPFKYVYKFDKRQRTIVKEFHYLDSQS